VPESEPSTTQGRVDLSIDSAQVKAGETFVLDVSVIGAEALGNLAFDLVFDSEALRLTDVSRATLAEDVLSAVNPEFYPSSLDTIRTNWVRAFGLAGDFNLISLAFQALEEAPTFDYPIRFENPAAYDTAYRPVSVVPHSAVISVVSDQTSVDLWMLH